MLSVGLLAACSAKGSGGGRGSGGTTVQTGRGNAPTPPIQAEPTTAPVVCGGGLSPKAYLLTDDGTFFDFDPATLAMHLVGTLPCPSSWPSRLAVARDGSAFMDDTDGDLYRFDPKTLACTVTPYTGGQLGFDGYGGIALAPSDPRLFMLGNSAAPVLAVSDLEHYRLFPVGRIEPSIDPTADLKVDAFGRMFALAENGTLTQLEPTTGAVLGQDDTGLSGTEAVWALLSYEDALYFFGSTEGSVSRYDLAAKTLTPVGQVNQSIVGTAAAPCVRAPNESDAGGAADAATEAGAPSADTIPFTQGDVWIGTYVCPQGLTDLALVVESAAGDSVKARFDFVSAKDDSAGSFELTGEYDATTGHTTFKPGAWVFQPAGSWQTVGMDGFVDKAGQEFAGTITSPGCGAFFVQR
jgi:hypothetical protein